MSSVRKHHVALHVSNMPTDSSQAARPGALLRVRGLSKRYPQGGWLSRHNSSVEVLRCVDLDLQAGSTLALIGASGSGKSTLARCLACLERPDSGGIWFDGASLATLDRRGWTSVRRQIQLVFQGPTGSLNPRFTAAEIVAEPLRIAGCNKNERRERAREAMELVGLGSGWEHRLPFEFSGGQRRRLAIARALILRPKLLILDEALTGLDLSVRAHISNLLLELQRSFSLTYLLISHDLKLVAHLADEVTVLHEGRIVANGPELAASVRHQHQEPGDLPATFELSRVSG